MNLKKILSGVIITGMIFTSALAYDFSDMPSESHWAYKALSHAIDKGLISGSDGMIAPQDNLTRAQMATILVRAYGETEMADMAEFTDVAEGAWYYEFMAKAVKMGIFKGDGSGLLNPDVNITRQEVFVVLSRAIGAEVGDVSVLDRFSDRDDIADWAKGGTASLIEKGYINGSDGKINPLSNITREEFAQIMYNMDMAGAINPDNNQGENTENNGSNTSGGSTSGGNTSGGSTSGGSTSGGSTSGGSTSGGSTSGGSTSGGNTGGSTGGDNTGGPSTGDDIPGGDDGIDQDNGEI